MTAPVDGIVHNIAVFGVIILQIGIRHILVYGKNRKNGFSVVKIGRQGKGGGFRMTVICDGSRTGCVRIGAGVGIAAGGCFGVRAGKMRYSDGG